MSQVSDKTAVVAFDVCRNEIAENGMYLPWGEAANIDWEQLEQLHILGSENVGNWQEGCYVDQDRALILCATETQIRMCISRCGRKMRILELSDASIRKIPEEVRALQYLRCLNLRGLHLEELPDWLPEITEQFTVDASVCGCGAEKAVVNFCNTEVTGVVMSVFEQPYAHVLQWFEKRRRGDAVPLNEARVVFLGDSESGKSHILARLLADGEEPGEKFINPPGLEIHGKDYMLDGRQIRIQFWDFGGQEIFHSMHRMFLTERTLYVIVLNVRDDTQNDRAQYWLHELRNYVNSAPVLLVLNKIDQNPDASVDKLQLKRIYSGLKDVIQVSGLKYSQDKFNTTFTGALLKQVRKLESLDALWPQSWMKVKSRLQNMDDCIVRGDVYRCLDDCCVAKQDWENLLGWINDLGMGFRYAISSEMGDSLVLSPGWLINAVYMLLINGRGVAVNGIVTHHAIQGMFDPLEMWKKKTVRSVYSDFRYDIADVYYILNILRNFGFSYRIEEYAEFIPALCQRESKPVAEEYKERSDTLEFWMSFEYLPENLIHRLIVKMQQDLDTGNVWRTGARFVYRDIGLSAVVMGQGNVLQIFVRSESHVSEPHTYLGYIKDLIEQIAAHMRLARPYSEIIYKTDGITEAFDYDDLLMALQDGETTYRSRKLREAISIHDILSQSDRREERALNMLLENLIRVCMRLQADKRLWITTADERNVFVQDALLNCGYRVEDRTYVRGGGLSGTALEIRRKRNIPWTVCGAVTIKDQFKTVWKAYLTTLLDICSHRGLNDLFLLTYVECEKDDFDPIVSSFYGQGQWDDEGEYVVCVPSTVTSSVVMEQYGNPAYLRIMECSYDRFEIPVRVFQIFVRMEPAQSETVDRNVPKPVQAESQENKPVPVLQDYRVVFLGDSEAGKSQLMYRVKNPEEEASGYVSKTTVGIDIYRRVETINDRSVRVNYWDFGGQEILHAMHRIFLAENTLYVIVLNTRNDSQDAQANFWLRYVEAYAPKAPVLLVMNKMDQNERASLNLPVLRRIFHREFSAEDVLKISALAEQSVFQTAFADKLQACIGRHISSTKDLTVQQSRIRDLVEKKKEVEKIISVDTFLEICKNESLCTEEEQTNLMNRFNDNGIVVHFRGKTLMFMNPEWITKTLYRILEEGGKVAENGVIRHSDLQTLCRNNPDKWRGSEDADHLVAIMRDYDFSFQYEKSDPKEKGTEDKEFIPVLCRREEPDAVEKLISRENILEMRIEFSYLPSDVLYQLMVRRKNDLDAAMVWASGAKFNFGSSSYAFVRRDGNTLNIFAYYPNEGTREKTVEYMYMLKDKVSEIVSERQSTARIQQIKIGYSVGSRMEYFDLHQLENAKSCGVYYTVSPGTEIRKIAVRDILDQQDRSTERKTDKLLADLSVACAQLQQNAPFLDPQENVRNSQIVLALKSQYDITDQTLVGKATSGKRQNELDMLVRFPNREPWMIIEALIVSPKKGMTIWNKHLDKLVGRYNASWGMRKLALVSYVDCPEPDFERLYKKYRDNMKTYSPVDAQIQESSFDKCPELSHNDYLKVDRCAYTKQERTIVVYHYFVRMEEKGEVHQQADIKNAEGEVVL